MAFDALHLVVVVPCALLAWWLRAVTRGGALMGGLLAWGLLAAGSFGAMGGLLLLLAGGTAVSRVGVERKLRAGQEQERGGRRGAVHALANAGPALLWLVFGAPALAAAACWGSLTCALSDTVSSELGLLARQPPRRLLVLAPVPAGTDGGMTPAGTLWGLLVAAVGGGVAGLVLASWQAGWAVAGGAFLGNLVDSLLGDGVEPHLPPGCANAVVNALSTAAGGGAAALLLAWST